MKVPWKRNEWNTPRRSSNDTARDRSRVRNLDGPLWLRWRLDQRVVASRKVPIEVQYESFGNSNEIYKHYQIVGSVKREIRCIYIRTTVGHLSFYREIEEAIQECWRT
ncbi:DNA-directed RNA polymerase subunit beta' [Platanthera guangdongensis]|uniref:DNA-directed RNA polymerase subunit beta n=1 Tax=Platanthera guangdongensis TaxID=2320717 RepID=A0ABR2MNX1_9ASPA